ncbi:MAG: DUF1638 domain-containing protein [Gammaproteobacteria bacterium]
MASAGRQLVIACGALAHEIAALRKLHGWLALEVHCLPPELHNRPERIAPAVREAIIQHRDRYAEIFVAYADCGTTGALDAVLREEGVERIEGVHCYQFFATPEIFAELAEAEPGSFFLTDFLVRHFDRLVFRGLGLDRHPQLQTQYFGNYRRLVYLAQLGDADNVRAAQDIAARLGLEYHFRHTGYGGLERSLRRFANKERH